jgi:hypothetical protein
MQHSAEFFCIAGSWNKILSAFTEAVKISLMWSYLPHGRNIKILSLALSNKKNWLRTMRHSRETIFFIESNRITHRIWIYIQNRFSPWISGPMGTVSQKTKSYKSRETVPLRCKCFLQPIWPNQFNPNPRCLWIKRFFFSKTEIILWWPSKIFFWQIRNASQNISANFCFRGVLLKHNF